VPFCMPRTWSFACVGATATRHAVAFQLAVRARTAHHAVLFQLAVGARAAHRAVLFQLPVKARVALRAHGFSLAVTARVARNAVLFPLAVRAGVAVHTLPFQPTVRAGVALCALVFQLAVRARVALRAGAFQLAVRAGVALHTNVFHPSMRASLHSHRSRATTLRAHLLGALGERAVVGVVAFASLFSILSRETRISKNVRVEAHFRSTSRDSFSRLEAVRYLKSTPRGAADTTRRFVVSRACASQTTTLHLARPPSLNTHLRTSPVQHGHRLRALRARPFRGGNHDPGGHAGSRGGVRVHQAKRGVHENPRATREP
jgi:hypothetical protein